MSHLALSPHAAPIAAAIQAGRKDFLDDLRRLVEHESPCGDTTSVPLLFDSITAMFASFGLLSERLGADGSMLLLRWRQHAEVDQLIVANVDTSWPAGTLPAMPFTVEDDVARGPGILDMKGGIALAAAAIRALHACDLSPALSPAILLTSDGNAGSPGSRATIQRLAHSALRAFILTPAQGPDGRLKSARKGVGHFRLHISRPPCHTGFRPAGTGTPMTELSHAVQTLFALNNPARGISVNVGRVDGGVTGSDCSCDVEVRVCSAKDAQSLERALHTMVAVDRACQITVVGEFDHPPMEATPGNVALANLAVREAAGLGFSLTHASAGSASDGNYTSQWCPTLDGIGAVGDGARTPLERICVSRTLERAALLALLLLAPS